MIRSIRKRDGALVEFDPSKLNRWGEWAAGIGVEWGSIVLEAVRKCSDGCTTADLHSALISACVERETEAHLKMAGRLYIGDVYKNAFGDWRDIPTVRQQVDRMTERGLYAFMDYSDAELDLCDSFINHNRDLSATLTETKQIMDKYAIKDRVDNKVYESPQFVYMRMALQNMEGMPSERRMSDVFELYDLLSRKKINPPTPFTINLGTPKKQYASCCVITTEDTAASLAAADHIAYMMTCASAGIGSHIKSRSKGDKVRQGAIIHQGKLPYYKMQQAAVSANLQSSRGGANTMHFNALDPEIFDLLRLKDVQTVADKRIKDIDYSFGYNDEFARRVAKNESWMLVSYGDAKDLYEAMYKGDQTEFLELYARYEKDEATPKEFVSAREIALMFLRQAVETGRVYEHNTGEMNRHTPFKDTIWSSNLCVAPETVILTDRGHLVIADVADVAVNVWNGSEWSEVVVRKTADSAKLIKVRLSDGKELECTPEHKFYVQDTYHAEKPREVAAGDLIPGDKLVKLATPVIDGTETLDKAYENGFFSGDGCYDGNHSRVYLYGEKMKLKPLFDGRYSEQVREEDGEVYCEYFNVPGLKPKFFVPGANYTVESRLNWLAGIFDADGYLAVNGKSQTLQLTSVERKFLKDIQLMLQTLGVESKVAFKSEAGTGMFPSKRGGEKREYRVKEAYRLLIGGEGLRKLLDLGIKFQRISASGHIPNRSAARFVTVVEVLDEGRISETYCFTEPKRHLGVFNGILTGQCQEIGLPTSGYESVADLYVRSPYDIDYVRGEIGLCNLAALSADIDDEEYPKAAYYACLMIDNVIDIMEYPFPQLAYTAKGRRSIGVGLTNVAYAMAKANVRYTTLEGKRWLHRLAEKHSYWLHKAAVRLARERGTCSFENKYNDGWLPIDTANREIDKIVEQPLIHDWEELRKEMLEVGGLRFSVLEAHMPCESSSAASGHTNSLYPIRGGIIIKTSGTNKNLFIAPEWDTLASRYELAWNVPAKDLTECYAVVQKFTGQAISADYYIKYASEQREVSSKQLLQDWLYRVKMGMKTRYYINSATGDEVAKLEEEVDDACAACKL